MWSFSKMNSIKKVERAIFEIACFQHCKCCDHPSSPTPRLELFYIITQASVFQTRIELVLFSMSPKYVYRYTTGTFCLSSSFSVLRIYGARHAFDDKHCAIGEGRTPEPIGCKPIALNQLSYNRI